MKHLIIGDVHGCGHELEKMILNHGLDKEIILVGDLFDRANDGVKVWELIHKYNIKALCGNHEVKILKYLSKQIDYIPNHYVKFMNRFAEQYDLRDLFDYCASLPIIKNYDNFSVVHGGIDMSMPEARNYHLNIWGNGEWWEKYDGNRLILFGHVSFPEPKVSRNKFGKINSIGLDTAACHGGKLTGYCPEDGEFFYVKAKDYFSKSKEVRVEPTFKIPNLEKSFKI